MNNCVDVKLGNCFEYALVYNQIDSPQLYLYVYIQYASKKTSHKRTVHAPFSSRSSPVRYNWLSCSCFCSVCPFFCTAEFLARAKLKSKAKKTTEKLGSMQKNI